MFHNSSVTFNKLLYFSSIWNPPTSKGLSNLHRIFSENPKMIYRDSAWSDSLLLFLLLVPSCSLHSRHTGFLASLNTQVPNFFVAFEPIVPFAWSTLFSDIECPVPSLPSGYYLNDTLSEKPSMTSNNTSCFSQFLHPGLFYFIASILMWQIFSHLFIVSLSP